MIQSILRTDSVGSTVQSAESASKLIIIIIIIIIIILFIEICRHNIDNVQ